MKYRIKIVNPTSISNWDELIQQHPDYSIFHSLAWLKVLQVTYHYEPCYFIIQSDERLLAVVPLLINKSYLTGKRAISLPFSDYCEPLINNTIDFEELLSELISFSKKQNLKYFELRGGKQYLSQQEPSISQYTHTLKLDKTKDELFASFRKKTRKSIRSAEREGIIVNIDNTLSSVEEYCKMNYVTRKIHGLPPQPTSFFNNLYNFVISKDLGSVSLAKIDDQVIAGAITLKFGKKILSKYSASYPKFRSLGSNYLVKWMTIKYCLAQNYQEMNFGRTQLTNKGLRYYKNGWGTEESISNVYRYDVKKEVFVAKKNRVTGFHNKVFKKIPIPLLKIFSNIFYKHFG